MHIQHFCYIRLAETVGKRRFQKSDLAFLAAHRAIENTRRSRLLTLLHHQAEIAVI